MLRSPSAAKEALDDSKSTENENPSRCRPPRTTSSPGLEAEFGVRNFWINDLLTGGHMLFPGFGVRPQSLRGSEGFGVLCVRLAPSQPDADGRANALTGA